MERNMTYELTRTAAFAVVMLCCGGSVASFAQPAPGMMPGVPSTGMTAGTATGMSTGLRTQPGMPTAVPRPGTATLTLGGILLNLGNLAAPAQIGPLGAITSCLAPGISTSPTSAPATAAFDAASGIIPSVPAGSTPAFGTISLSAICNPITPGSPTDSTAAPDPNAAAAFVNGALPLTSVESGSPGMSPSIVVPPPAVVPAVAGGMSSVAGGVLPLTLSMTGSGTGSSSTGLGATDLGAMDVTGIANGDAASGQIVTMPPPAISSSGCTGDPSCGAGP
jgi:hypothetical protein